MTIAFLPEGAYGPTNNCVGIADVLRRRGHRVVFIVAGEEFLPQASILPHADVVGAIDRLVADRALRERLAAVTRRLQAAPGTVAAADRIERVAAAA